MMSKTVFFWMIATSIVSVPSRGAEPDLSSPKAALKSLCKAVDAQDGTAILKTFYAADDGEKDLARAFSDLIVAGKKLNEASRAEFGSAGDGLGSGMMNPAELARLDQAEIQETGDTATLVPAGQSRTVRFHRTEGRWQVVIRDFANAGQDLPHQVSLLKKVAGVFNGVADDVAASKFDSSEEAEAAIQTKLANVMIHAATRATSRPATKP